MATKKTAKRRKRTLLDRTILEALARLPKPYDVDDIIRTVEADLPARVLAGLTPSLDIVRLRRIRKRVWAILRHAAPRPIRRDLQDHYRTKDGGWEACEEMSKETAMLNFEEVDHRRRRINAEHTALKGLIRQKWPDALIVEDEPSTGDLFDEERA
jgi:hypothetical protein